MQKKSSHSIKDVNLRLFIYIGKLLYTHKFTRSFSLPEYLVRQAKNAKAFLTSKINNTVGVFTKLQQKIKIVKNEKRNVSFTPTNNSQNLACTQDHIAVVFPRTAFL